MNRARALVGRLPRAGRACFLIALVNSVIWGIVIPPFMVPDETSHFAYAQYLAETGKPPPQGSGSPYSPQEDAALRGLFFYQTIGDPRIRGVLTPAENQALRRELARHPSPLSDGAASSATNQPPLYYALAAIPYWLSPATGVLGRLSVMRLLSALLAAGTALSVFLFLRECFPRDRWSWTAGSLIVAFQPMVGFISGGVQGDNLLYLAAAVVFLLLARVYRRGLTVSRAVGLGAAAAAGMLAKLTFLALVPGIALAVLLLAWRARAGGVSRAVRMAFLAGLVALVPVVLYGVLNVAVWHRGGFLAGGTAGATGSTLAGGGTVTMGQSIDYIWEQFLPRLPFMHWNFFPGQTTLVTTWLDGFIGRFGWLDYSFPAWVYELGHGIALALLVLAGAGIVRLRHRVRRALPLLVCFAVMTAGLCVAIGYAGVRYQLSTGFPFAQARYLFPLLALYGAFTMLSAHGLGRRVAPALAAILVLLALAHTLFAETLTISRYYG